jgi:hypothetical protein
VDRKTARRTLGKDGGHEDDRECQQQPILDGASCRQPKVGFPDIERIVEASQVVCGILARQLSERRIELLGNVLSGGSLKQARDVIIEEVVIR